MQKSSWTDRERVLLLCSRGSLARTRHLVNDLKRLMPHVHPEAKFDKKSKLENLNEICELANCTKSLYFESRKGRDVYLWASNVDGGPSVKFLVHNMHTMNELSLAGNCLKGSRPVLSFDSQFDENPHLKLVKEVFMHTFKTPNFHPRSQPFIDHVLNFSLTSDGRIWFRNYQIVDEQCELQEIGPRFVLEIIRIFDGSFQGTVLYENPNYQTPNAIRNQIKVQKANEYHQKLEQKESAKVKDNLVRSVKIEDPIGEIFDTTKTEPDVSADTDEKPDMNEMASSLERKILKPTKRKLKKKKQTGASKKQKTD